MENEKMTLMKSENMIENALSVDQIKAQVGVIQKVMRAVMKENVDFGIIKGCGNKPTLLKAGSEKILSTFRIGVDPQVEDLSTQDEIRYRVITKGIYTPSGAFLGAGVGEASSNEEKYKWREAICQKEFDETPEDKRRIKYKKNWGSGSVIEIKQVRCNPADIANTVLKMAKKRSQIDMTLTITGASSMFTQDIEDLVESGVIQKKEYKPEFDMPKETEVKTVVQDIDDLPPIDIEIEAPLEDAVTVTPSTQEALQERVKEIQSKVSGRVITQKQKKFLYAKSKEYGIDAQTMKDAMFGMFKKEHSADLTSPELDQLLKWMQEYKKAL